MTVDSQHCHKQHPLVRIVCLVDWLCKETIRKKTQLIKVIGLSGVQFGL